MRVGWIASVTGCFGAVREMVETSNALVRLGHTVTIYSEAGDKITWLPYLGAVGTFADAKAAHDDVCIALCDWKRPIFEVWKATTPRLHVVSVMGFDASMELGEILRGDVVTVDSSLRVMREALHLPGVVALCDSSWQAEWLQREVGVECAPPMGGVNLQQFTPSPKTKRDRYRILATGDPRERKGSVVVRRAFERINQKKVKAELVTYWNQRIPQAHLAGWYSDGDVFADAERRAGWANPVAEAMACGTAVVSTNIGAVRDFAVHDETALLVPVDDDTAMAAAIVRLLHDADLRNRLVTNGLEKIKQFDYTIIGKNLAAYLEARLGA